MDLEESPNFSSSASKRRTKETIDIEAYRKEQIRKYPTEHQNVARDMGFLKRVSHLTNMNERSRKSELMPPASVKNFPGVGEKHSQLLH